MYLTCKIALQPNKEQEAFFWECANAARFVYNFSLNLKTEAYKTEGVSLDSNNITKYITQLKHTEQYKWLNEVPSETIKYAVKDMDNAFKNFFKGKGYPNFKKKSTTIPSFYTRYDKMHSVDEKHIKICGIKQPIKTYEKCLIPETPRNPRIKYDGKYWYLTFGVEIAPENKGIPIIQKKMQIYSGILNKNITPALGIDLGILNTATCSNGVVYKNINKDSEIIRLEKKKKRLQQQVSRKYNMNKKGNKFIKTQNIKKVEKKIKLVQRRINNIRNTYINQMTTEIVKTKPSKIVIEDLAVSNMLKNKYLANSIQEQKWYEIRRQLEYKSSLYMIKIQVANRFYASSKTCSNCGYINKTLKLSDRTFKCPKCGLIIDRDCNASINLSKQ